MGRIGGITGEIVSLQSKLIEDWCMVGNRKYTFLRISIVTAIAVFINVFVHMVMEHSHVEEEWLYYIYMIVAFNLVSEGNVLINRYFDLRHPWYLIAMPRIVKQLTASLVWTVIAGVFFYFVVPRHDMDEDLYNRGFLLIFGFGAIFIMGFDAFLFIRSFFKNWQSSFQENERLKIEKLRTEYMALQNQLNPHFLFNSLSVLISEIRFDPAKAELFARRMSDVYRYVLQCKDVETVPLEKELQFIDHFVFMHKIRLGDAIQYHASVNPGELKIPPLTLQLLVENAIKHNKATQKQPLVIEVLMEGDHLVVKNNLQGRSTTPSHGKGLEILKGRFGLLYGEDIEITTDDAYFVVRLPLKKAV